MNKPLIALILIALNAPAIASVTCINTGGLSLCSGVDADGNAISTSTVQSGDLSTTTGTAGEEVVNLTTINSGQTSIMNGTVGDKAVTQTCQTTGTITTCN